MYIDDYPYTNFHELNLDWVLETVEELADQWGRLEIDVDFIEDGIENINKRFATLETELKADIAETEQSLEGEISTAVAGMTTTVTQQLEQTKTEIEAELDAYKAQTTSDISADIAAQDARITAVESSQSSYQTNLTNAWNLYKDTVNGDIAAVEADLQSLHDYVDNYFATLDVSAEVTAAVQTILDDWIDDGTIIDRLLPSLPFVTPELFGAVGDGSTDDSVAIQAAVNATFDRKKPLYFLHKTYYSTAAISISGPIYINGQGAVVKFAAGVNGFVMTGSGAGSVISDLTIDSLDATGSNWPDDTGLEYGFTLTESSSDLSSVNLGDIGLTIGGDHITIRNVTITHFNTGLFFDERLQTGTQTGCVFDGLKCRYVNASARFGWTPKNNLTTDYVISNCVFTGTICGAQIMSCITYLIDNLHTWGTSSMRFALWTLDTSFTEIVNSHFEAVTDNACYMHVRKGVNIDNVAYYDPNATSGKRIFRFTGVSISAANPGGPVPLHVSIDNLIIRAPYNVTMTVAYFDNDAVFALGSVIVSDRTEYDFSVAGLPTANITYAQYAAVTGTKVKLLTGRDISKDNTVIDIGGVKLAGGYFSVTGNGSTRLSIYNTSAFWSLKKGQAGSILVTATTRRGNYNCKAGVYIIPYYVTGDGAPHIDTTNAYQTLTANSEISQIDVTVDAITSDLYAINFDATTTHQITITAQILQ